MTAASEHVEHQAARRLIQIESNGSPHDWAGLDAWLGEHPRNRAVFLRLSLAWRRADALAVLRTLGPRVDENCLGPGPRYARAVRRSISGKRHYLAAAAALIAAIGIAQLLGRDEAVVRIHQTAAGQPAAFALSDGSHVTLNTSSRVAVKYGRRLRELTLLAGEIAVEVRSDARRPFVLRSGNYAFRVLGTAFSVRAHPDGRIEVAVSEGRVAVEADGVLEAGDIATIRGATIHKRKVPLEILMQKLAWTHGRLFFDGETLSAAASEFNRYNQVQLHIADPKVGSLRIFGTFEADEPQMFVAALEQPFGIRPGTLDRSGRSIRLERRSR